MVVQKQSYSLCLNKIIYLFYLTLLLQISKSIVLRSIPQIQTRLVVVYNNSILQMPASTTTNFTLLFTTAFNNTPAVAVGNGGYYSLDRYYNEFWGLSSSVLTNFTGLTIHVRLQTNTKTNILYISYLAVDDIPLNENLFNIYYSEYNQTQLINSSNTTTSRGNVTDIVYYTPTGGVNFPTNSMVACVTNKAYMRNSGAFGFLINCGLFIQTNNSNNETYSNSLIITIQSINTNVLDSIGFYSIILNKNIISPDNYYQSYLGSISAMFTNSDSRYYIINFTQTSVFNYTSTTVSQIYNCGIFMGFKNIMGSASDIIGFHWNYQYENSTHSQILIKNNFGLSLLVFDFFIFGVVDCVYWSVFSQICVSSCAINQTNQISSNICRLCASNCKTCSYSTSNCTSCQYGLYYLEAYSCNSCNSSILTDSQKSACGIPIDQPLEPPTVNNSPYWVGGLGVIPVIAILIICYCRKWRAIKIQLKQRSGVDEHPSIEL